MNNKYKKIKKIFAIVILIICVYIPINIALAKFYKSYAGNIDNNKNKIADFYVDITDHDKKPIVNNIGIENLNPGDKKEVVFYVRNGCKDESEENTQEQTGRISDVNIDYSISLLHTNNLPVEYKLYKVENGDDSNKTEVVSTTVKNASSEINDSSEIKFGSDSNYKFVLSMDNKDTDGITYDKYILEVSWDKSKSDTKYIKEVDLVYMIVDAVQKDLIQ